MKLVWRKWQKTPPDWTLGHGLCIYDRSRTPGAQIIAFVDGYEWYNGKTPEATIYTIKPDNQTPPAVLKQMREILKKKLKPKSFPSGTLTRRLDIVANA
jgi:hypothetical protein